MTRMRQQVETHDVDAWAKSFLAALAAPQDPR
jgi:trehalose-6-phosphate synthase